MLSGIAVSRSRRHGFALWSGLALCMGIGPLMLYTLTAVSPLVITDLGLSSVQYGAVTTVAFTAAAVGALLLGGATSRFEGRNLMVAVSVGSAVALGLLAVAAWYLVVLIAAVISGLAQSLSNPATNRVVARLDARRRGALIGWKQSGVQMAQLPAGLMAPALAILAGWRWAAAAGVLLAVLGVMSARSIQTPTPAATPLPTEAGQGRISVPTLTAYTFCMGFGLQATNAYMPLFAHTRVGFGVGTAGLTAAVIGCVGLVSRIWWARASDRDGLRSSTFVVLASASALGVTLVLSAPWAGGWLVWIGAAVFGAAALASNAVTMVALIRAVPAESLGAATGLLTTGMYLGFALGPLAFGVVLDRSAAFGLAWLVPLCAFAVAFVIALPNALNRSTPSH